MKMFIDYHENLEKSKFLSKEEKKVLAEYHDVSAQMNGDVDIKITALWDTLKNKHDAIVTEQMELSNVQGELHTRILKFFRENPNVKSVVSPYRGGKISFRTERNEVMISNVL